MPLNKEAYIRYKIIDACINNKQKPFPSMDELIEVCEEKLGKSFTVSTLQKDIKSMKEDEALGFLAPIKFSKSKNGYYYSDSEFSINKIPLQHDEIEALKNANDILQAFGGRQLNDAYNQAYIKLMDALDVNKIVHKNEVPHIYSEQPPPHSGFRHFYTILEAIKNKQTIKFGHINYHKVDSTEPIVHPYQLIEFNHYWYVAGYSQERKAIRVFGLDRIVTEITFPDIPFNPIAIKDIKKYNKDMYGVFPYDTQAKQEIVFVCSAFMSNYIEMHPIHDSQLKLKSNSKETSKFSINVIPTFELTRWFFSNATDIEVKNLFIKHEIKKMAMAAFKKTHLKL